MTYLERKEKENYLIYLIENSRLISLRNTAEDFNCSIRTLKRMLSNLREQGYDITYCKIKCSYYINK